MQRSWTIWLFLFTAVKPSPKSSNPCPLSLPLSAQQITTYFAENMNVFDGNYFFPCSQSRKLRCNLQLFPLLETHREGEHCGSLTSMVRTFSSLPYLFQFSFHGSFWSAKPEYIFFHLNLKFPSPLLSTLLIKLLERTVHVYHFYFFVEWLPSLPPMKSNSAF